jgi:hypothetical protein
MERLMDMLDADRYVDVLAKGYRDMDEELNSHVLDAIPNLSDISLYIAVLLKLMKFNNKNKDGFTQYNSSISIPSYDIDVSITNKNVVYSFTISFTSQGNEIGKFSYDLKHGLVAKPTSPSTLKDFLKALKYLSDNNEAIFKTIFDGLEKEYYNNGISSFVEELSTFNKRASKIQSYRDKNEDLFKECGLDEKDKEENV